MTEDKKKTLTLRLSPEDLQKALEALINADVALDELEISTETPSPTEAVTKATTKSDRDYEKLIEEIVRIGREPRNPWPQLPPCYPVPYWWHRPSYPPYLEITCTSDSISLYDLDHKVL